MHHRHAGIAIVLCLTSSLLVPAASADPTPAFEAMATAGAAYINDYGSCPGIISAPAVFDNLADFTVIDIRSEAAYDMGHIPGAYHSSLATLLDDLAGFIPTHRPYVIAGYSGQTAGLAKIAMVLLGYQDVYTLLFGMSAWNSTLDVWTANCADDLAAPETENQNGSLVEQPFPDLAGNPDTIVAERAAAMLAQGFRGVSYADIQDNLEDYFIINYFGEADYLGEGVSGVPGHIPGAYQFTPFASMGPDQMLNNIPADMPIVVYGWTGQHESQVVAYLNMLGYDAYVLKFGANSLFYSSLTAHKWTTGAMNDFPLSYENPLAAPDVATSPIAHLANHPNPFNPVTTIAYHLTAPARITLRVYDLSRRLVRELLPGVEQSAGLHEAVWRGEDSAGRAAPSGTYLYRLTAGNHVELRRMALLK